MFTITGNLTSDGPAVGSGDSCRRFLRPSDPDGEALPLLGRRLSRPSKFSRLGGSATVIQ
jgi:hypothetical protein